MSTTTEMYVTTACVTFITVKIAESTTANTTANGLNQKIAGYATTALVNTLCPVMNAESSYWKDIHITIPIVAPPFVNIAIKKLLPTKKLQAKTKLANLKGDTNMKNKFERICKMTQKNLKKYVSTELKTTHPDVKKGDGWVFAKGTFPVLLVAHLDTVHHELPRNIVYDFEKGTVSSPQGIGGDDRCGILMILEIVKAYNCSVLFWEDEEIGCVGAGKFIKTDLAASLEFNYIIEFDRRGSNDAVFYECDNPDFEEFITKEFYKTAYGSMSDISELAPFLGCAAVNLSCGYYNAHTTKEYVVFKEMIASMNAACRILDRTTTETKFLPRWL